MNRWQIFWRSMDEARLFVRVVLVGVLFVLLTYMWWCSKMFFFVVETAQMGSNAASEVPVLTAVTVFVVGNLKMVMGFVSKLWLDYRNSGTDWGEKEYESLRSSRHRKDTSHSGAVGLVSRATLPDGKGNEGSGE